MLRITTGNFSPGYFEPQIFTGGLCSTFVLLMDIAAVYLAVMFHLILDQFVSFTNTSFTVSFLLVLIFLSVRH
jgi:hypothetical protein